MGDQRHGTAIPRDGDARWIELAVEIALLAILSVLRKAVLFGEAWPGEDVLAPEVLAAELARLSVGYLGIRGRRVVRR